MIHDRFAGVRFQVWVDASGEKEFHNRTPQSIQSRCQTLRRVANQDQDAEKLQVGPAGPMQVGKNAGKRSCFYGNMNGWLDKQDDLPLFSDSAAASFAPGQPTSTMLIATTCSSFASTARVSVPKKPRVDARVFTDVEEAFLSICFRHDKLNDTKSRAEVAVHMSARGMHVSEERVARWAVETLKQNKENKQDLKSVMPTSSLTSLLSTPHKAQ